MIELKINPSDPYFYLALYQIGYVVSMFLWLVLNKKKIKWWRKYIGSIVLSIFWPFVLILIILAVISDCIDELVK